MKPGIFNLSGKAPTGWRTRFVSSWRVAFDAAKARIAALKMVAGIAIARGVPA